MNGACCMTAANGQEYPGAPAHDYDCPVGGSGYGDYDGHGPGFDAGDYDGPEYDDGGIVEADRQYYRDRDARRLADYDREGTQLYPVQTLHVVAPRLPVVQNPPTPEALIVQLRWQVPVDYERSMATFRAARLTDTTLGWLIAVTQMKFDLPTDARWRYFCGCCWRTIRGEH
ncbi:hypothetical protein SEA_LIGMA_79 [Gordonia phage Ligma]|nr:hypothetical protein SEA_LIGMA_79 [Gordonia phage Ligma]UQT02178.1 hypothetical protein SEA_AXUMITE_79 [Gordonia phage Axumite]